MRRLGVDLLAIGIGAGENLVLFLFDDTTTPTDRLLLVNLTVVVVGPRLEQSAGLNQHWPAAGHRLLWLDAATGHHHHLLLLLVHHLLRQRRRRQSRVWGGRYKRWRSIVCHYWIVAFRLLVIVVLLLLWVVVLVCVVRFFCPTATVFVKGASAVGCQQVGLLLFDDGWPLVMESGGSSIAGEKHHVVGRCWRGRRRWQGRTDATSASDKNIVQQRQIGRIEQVAQVVVVINDAAAIDVANSSNFIVGRRRRHAGHSQWVHTSHLIGRRCAAIVRIRWSCYWLINWLIQLITCIDWIKCKCVPGL